VGLTASHRRGELTRAVLEGVVFSLRDGLAAMREIGVADEQIRAVGGGARSPLWRQMQADVFDRAVLRPAADEGPAYGAALLAGVSVGVWRDVADTARLTRRQDAPAEPDRDRVRRYDELYGIYRSLYPKLRDAMHALAG
jgi:xylulokinase